MRVSVLSIVLRVGLSYLALMPRAYASESPLTIHGWPLAGGSLEKLVLNQDDLMGTYVCPALTRLNLMTSRSEPVLLESLTTSKNSWSLVLKKNAQWWDGQSVKAEELEAYLKTEIPLIAKRVLGDKFEVPPFKTTVKNNSVVIAWDKDPGFGPYLLNRQPFYRGSGPSLQCAGPLKAMKVQSDIELTGTLKGKARTIRLTNEVLKPGAAQPYVSFRFGDELHPPTVERQLEEELKCSLSVDFPLVSLIAWNPNGHFTKDPEFRRAMTYLLPRGALLRAGAGQLGDLLSAPILRVHPGYKKRLLVLPNDLRKTDAILNQQGLVRSSKDGFRRMPGGEVVSLTLGIDSSPDTKTIRKILDDSFRALGIKLNFTAPKPDVDGVLTGVDLSWPENDLAPLLQTGSTSQVWPWTYNFPELDEALTRYNLSLTREKADLTLLENIHDLVYKREPFSVLVQHRACVELSGKASAPKALNIKNPDWIRALIER